MIEHKGPVQVQFYSFRFTMQSEEQVQSEFVHVLSNHESELRDKLCEQWQQGKHCDVTMSVEGGEFQAHSCVLAAFSPKLKDILSSTSVSETGNPKFIPLTFQNSVVGCLLTMMYTGVLSFSVNILPSVMSTARWFQMDEVVRLCEQYEQLETGNSSEMIPTDNDVLTEVNDECNVEGEVYRQNMGYECNKLKTSAKAVSKRRSKRQDHCQTFLASHKKNKQKRKIPDFSDSLTVKIEPITDDYGNITDGEVNQRNPDGPEDAKPNSSTATKKTATKNKVKRSKAKKSKPKPTSLKSQKAVTALIGTTQEFESPLIEEQPSLLSHMQWVEAQTSSTDNDEADFAMGKTDHVRCKRCLMKFTDLDKYFSHITDHPSFMCLECNAIYYRQSNLTRHMRTVHSSQHQLHCKKCEHVAKTEKMLRNHFKETHGSDKPFLCEYPECTYAGWKYDALRRHSEIHSEVKQYVCNKCGQGFSQHAGLMSHERTCYQLQQFLCDVCGQAFNHVQSMRAHRRSVHFGEKPFLCKVCGNQFSDHRNLKRHMRIHENIFPYHCPMCQQNYRHSNSLKAHLKKHGEFSLNLNVSEIMKMPSSQNTKPTTNAKQTRKNKGNCSSYSDDNLTTTAEFQSDFCIEPSQIKHGITEVTSADHFLEASLPRVTEGAPVNESKMICSDNLLLSCSKTVCLEKEMQSSCVFKELDSVETSAPPNILSAMHTVVSDEKLNMPVDGASHPVNSSSHSSNGLLVTSSLDSSAGRLESLISSSDTSSSAIIKVEV